MSVIKINAQSISSSDGGGITGYNRPPNSNWQIVAVTPDVSNRTQPAGDGSAYWSDDMYPLPLPPTGHTTWISLRDLGNDGDEEQIKTQISGLQVGKTYEIVFYALTSTSDPRYYDYSKNYNNFFSYQVGNNSSNKSNFNHTLLNTWQEVKVEFVATNATMDFNLFSGNDATGDYESTQISIEQDSITLVDVPDDDGDGVPNSLDKCPGYDDAIDTDNDGIPDGCDQDDDNDGILDSNEGKCTLSQSGSWNISGQEASFDYGNGVIAKVEVVDNATFNFESENFNTQNFWSENIGGDSSLSCDFEFGSTMTVRFEDAAGNPIKVNNPEIHFDRIGGSAGTGLGYTVQNAAKITLQDGLTWGRLAGTSDFEATSNTVTDKGAGTRTGSGFSFQSTMSDNDGTAAGSLRINGTISSFSVKFEQNGSFGEGGDAIEIILFGCKDRDTDNDGFPDYLDIDSDNDRCPDALEGTNTSLTLANLDSEKRISGGVNNTTGIPTAVGNGQNDVSSTNFNVTGPECDDDGDGVPNKSDVCPGHDDTVDTDKDGVPNGCDVDDDNDGILDVDERPCFAFRDSFGMGSGTPQSSHSNVPSGKVENVFVGTNTDAGSKTWFRSIDDLDAAGDAEGRYLGLDNPLDPTPAIMYKETITVVPNEEYSYTLFAAAAAESQGQPLSGYPDVRMQIKDDAGNVLKVVNTGTVPLEWTQYELLFTPTTTTVTFEIFNNNADKVQNALLIDEIFISLISCDTDGDGIPNSMDTDSDNDGCPDAVEGAGNIVGGLSTLENGSPSPGSSENLGTDSDAQGRPKLNPTDTDGYTQDPTEALIDENINSACKADLNLTLTVNNATPKVGDDIIYTFKITNSGPLNGTGVQVTQVLPTSGVTYVSDNVGGAYDNSTQVWTVGSLNVGETKVLQVTAKVNNVGKFENKAEITNSDFEDIDSQPNNNK